MAAATTPTPETPDVVVGNYLHKPTARNPAIRWLTGRFLARLDGLLDRVQAEAPTARVLEVGCGEGEIAQRLHARWGDVTALDLPDARLRGCWRDLDGPRFVHADAERLPFPDASFDVVAAVEVLEHLRQPEAGLAEIRRVARCHLVLSVPREPLFRLGNLLAGRHLRDLGNTPGHLNHWSPNGFVRFVSQAGGIRQVRKPLPWTLAWARVR